MTNGHVYTKSASSGRSYTVSIAVPGSVIDNTQTMEAATAVAGQIARTAAIFNIDEVIVIDDAQKQEAGTVGSGAAFLARVLQFMETPQYLRRYWPKQRLQPVFPLVTVQSLNHSILNGTLVLMNSTLLQGKAVAMTVGKPVTVATFGQQSATVPNGLSSTCHVVHRHHQ